MRTLLQKEWFGAWFDSPYYHILYQHRDTTEAQRFMDNLSRFMGFGPQHRLLDLACGKGRHAIYLNQKGFHVEGVDLSAQSIAHASQFANSRLQFAVHDMREIYKPAAFDVVLNLFTSFGFFASEQEHQQAVSAAAAALRPGGYLVMDFFNTYKVIDSLVQENTTSRQGIDFLQRRYLEEGVIVKDILFEDGGRAFHFQERVAALEEADFRRYFRAAGLQVVHLFGDYDLGFFRRESSDRMIFIVRLGGA